MNSEFWVRDPSYLKVQVHLCQYIFAARRPWPVQKRWRIAQCWHGRLMPGGQAVRSVMRKWFLMVVCGIIPAA